MPDSKPRREFKVGDRVRHIRTGSLGRVMDFSMMDRDCVIVVWDLGLRDILHRNRLEHVDD